MKEIYEMLSKARAALCDVEGVDLVVSLLADRLEARVIYHRENALDMTMSREFSCVELENGDCPLWAFVSESVGRAMIAKGASDDT